MERISNDKYYTLNYSTFDYHEKMIFEKILENFSGFQTIKCGKILSQR
jgi:hypothetical protein